MVLKVMIGLIIQQPLMETSNYMDPILGLRGTREKRKERKKKRILCPHLP